MKIDIGASPRHDYFVDFTRDEFLKLIELAQSRFVLLGSTAVALITSPSDAVRSDALIGRLFYGDAADVNKLAAEPA
jgi:hypothetical protein